MLRRYLRYIVTGMAVAGILILIITIGNFQNRPVYAAETTASSNSDEDVQAAIDYIEGLGAEIGIVNLPSGNGTWDTNVTISTSNNISLVGAGANITIINVETNISLIIAGGADNTRVTGFSMRTDKGDAGNAMIVGGSTSDTVVDWRIDHCSFYGFGEEQSAIFVRDTANRGLVDHCDFDAYTDPDIGYGVVVYRNDTFTSDMSSIIGTQDLVYIEDCQFLNCRHSIAAGRGSRYVGRYNIIHEAFEAACLDQHGQTSLHHSSDLMICYQNTIVYTNGESNKCMVPRGGMALFYDNTIYNFTYSTVWKIEDPNYLDEKVHDCYEWDNTPGTVTEIDPNGDISNGVDYFNATEYVYTPFTYPHPLQAWGEEGGESSPVTNNPSAANITIYVTPGVIGGSCNVSSYNWGNLVINSTSNTSVHYVLITNESTVTSNWTAQMVNATWTGGATPWTHSDTATAGNNTAGIKIETGSYWGAGPVVVPYSTSVLIKGEEAALDDFDFGISLIMPTASSVKDEKTNVLEITVTVP